MAILDVKRRFPLRLASDSVKVRRERNPNLGLKGARDEGQPQRVPRLLLRVHGR